MHTYKAAALLSLVASFSDAADQPRPRGVGPDFAKFYKSPSTFTCISNPSINLPPSSINDDYCDCPDGSDEPGTSACAHLSPYSPSIQPPPNAAAASAASAVNSTLALPGYYCKNKGHKPAYIPFTHLNDGVCDYDICCDGSDEWSGVSGTKCENRCTSIGQEWRRLDEKKNLSFIAAKKKRTELVAEAKRMRDEMETWIREKKPEIEDLEKQVAHLEKERDEIERKDKSKVFKKSKEDGKGGTVGVLLELTKQRIGELRDALNRVVGERNGYLERTQELEDIMTRLEEDRNQDNPDPALFAAMGAWEGYKGKERTSHGDDAQERDLQDMMNGNDGIQWEDFETQTQPSDEEGDIEVLYRFEEYLPQPIKEWLDAQLRNIRLLLIQNGILSSKSSTSSTSSDPPESAALKAARERLSTVRNSLNDLTRERDTKTEDLSRDFGHEHVFQPMKGKCISADSGEYTYELCWLGGVTQIPKKGGMNNGMGRFERFDTVEVDGDVDAEGRGLGKGRRLALLYENGMQCWQGPQRSTVVVLGCAENEEVWKVTEEAKCEYRMEVGTPAACGFGDEVNRKEGDAGAGAGAGAGGKEEL
ncbi:MAG: hypothetical protein M1831_006347 [Alyxoria varia]|nr:MAG: hypothetical protein M1831_006347 [Alyxoria varia]